MKAALRLRVEDNRVVDLRVEPPLGAKVIRSRRGLELHLVATAAGLLEGDELAVSVHVGDGSSLSVVSAGATLVHPSLRGPATRLVVEARVGAAASLAWWPEPLIAAAGAFHHSGATVSVAVGGRLRWVEELVLGRTGEPVDAIRCTTELLVDGPDGPVLHDGLEVGGPGWNGPAVLGGARYVGSVVDVGAGPGDDALHSGEVFVLAGGGRLTRVVDADPLAGRARLRALAAPARVPVAAGG